MDPESVVKCVNFMYSGKVPKNVENPAELLMTARLLRLPKICHEMAATLQNGLDSHNLIPIRHLACVYGFENLVKECDKVAVYQFHALMKSDGFKEFDAKYLEFLLSSKDLKIFDDIKCKAILTWVNHGQERVKIIFNLMMQHIDILNVDLCYRKFLLDQPSVFKSPECVKFITDSIPEGVDVNAADYQGDCNPSIIIINKNAKTLERYDLVKKSWIEMHSLRDYSEAHSSFLVLVGKYLYLIKNGRALLRLKVTNSKATWEELSLPLSICCGPITHLDGMIYVFEKQRSAGILQYDLASDRWCRLPPKMHKTSGSCIVAACGRLFVIGGQEEYIDFCLSGYEDFGESVRYVECFDPSSLSWSQPVGHLSDARSNASASTYQGNIYVFGGHEQEDLGLGCFIKPVRSMEILISGEFRWMLIQMDNLVRYSFLSHTLNGKIYLVGGDWDVKEFSDGTVICSSRLSLIHI